MEERSYLNRRDLGLDLASTSSSCSNRLRHWGSSNPTTPEEVIKDDFIITYLTLLTV